MFAVSIKKKNLPSKSVSVNPKPGYFPALPLTQSVKRPGFNKGFVVSLCVQCSRLPHDGRRTHLCRFTRKDFDCLTFPGRDNQPPLASSRCTWLACHSDQSTNLDKHVRGHKFHLNKTLENCSPKPAANQSQWKEHTVQTETQQLAPCHTFNGDMVCLCAQGVVQGVCVWGGGGVRRTKHRQVTSPSVP